MLIGPAEDIVSLKFWHNELASRSGAARRITIKDAKSPLYSSDFELVGGNLYTFSLKLSVEGNGVLQFGLAAVASGLWAHYRLHDCAGGEEIFSLAFRPDRTAHYRLLLGVPLPDSAPLIVIDPALEFSCVTAPSSPGIAGENGGSNGDTYLPHWGVVRRFIHRRCKRSRSFNNLVAAIEMRLNREEVLSLPQYMALCPTGQCNARCGFCSVTINRTGIVKKQIPFDRLRSFLSPVQKTIQMYGIEGNGEPTLYHQFQSLVDVLTAGGSQAYLITNGSQLTSSIIPSLLALESVNFSLNACNDETHRRVMKLKNFDEIVCMIRAVIRQGGYSDINSRMTCPRVSASFVVTNDNVNEVQDFLRFAEYDLGVDVIMIRPLSELGNEVGAVEDLRDIVPVESDIRDMLDAVQDYLSDVKRRAEVRIAPETFKSYRYDPIDRAAAPRGFEGRFLAPRRRDWIPCSERLVVTWNLNIATISWPGGKPAGPLWRSRLVPVPPHRTLTFRCSVRTQEEALVLSIRNEADVIVAETAAPPGIVDGSVLTLEFNTGTSPAYYLAVSGGGGALRAEIDFERLRTPPPFERSPDHFAIPRADRWETTLPTVDTSWSGTRVRLRWNGDGGPYLLKSYMIPCVSDAKISLVVDLSVVEGALGIGILNERFDSWLANKNFEPGQHSAPIEFETSGNSRVQIVVYAVEQRPLEASIDFRMGSEAQAIETPPEMASPTYNPGSGSPTREFSSALASEAAESPPTLEPHNKVARPGMLEAASRSKRDEKALRFYCQKPWTDLHNFSVDGRMDVCCIATGASQERFQLGNLNNQTFQEVWNGERAQEFRRTVNGDDRLPPCARCPMSYAYQGRWFDPAYTEFEIHGALGRLKSRYIPGSTALANGAQFIARKLLDRVVFNGFQRKV